MWNFAECIEEGILEIDEIYSNDIFSMLQIYGVELARAAILREMKGIFAAYNIDVNRRHLELIADYMVNPSLFSEPTWTEKMYRHSKGVINPSIAKDYQQIRPRS